MGIEAKFTAADVARMMALKVERLNRVIENELVRIGLLTVTYARSVRTYRDVTGNLRSSIGFIVLKNGVPVHENFEASDGGSDKATGLNKARSYIKRLSAQFKQGYALIVVAGMGYAAYVEARNKDVLTGSSLEAKKHLRRALQTIKNRVK